MLHSRYIVVVDLPNGETETAYQGPDSAKADRVFAEKSADSRADAVLLFCHPLYSRVRYPIAEALGVKERAAENDRRAGLAQTAKARLLASKVAQAKALATEISGLESEARPAKGKG